MKTLLNQVQHFADFVDRSAALRGGSRDVRIKVQVEPHAGIHRLAVE